MPTHHATSAVFTITRDTANLGNAFAQFGEAFAGITASTEDAIRAVEELGRTMEQLSVAGRWTPTFVEWPRQRFDPPPLPVPSAMLSPTRAMRVRDDDD
jgi:hypothetical protein